MPDDSTPPGGTSHRPEEGTLDDLFDALAHPRRRRILRTLANATPRQDPAFGPEEFVPAAADRDQVLIGLRHTHLPKLANVGVIEWDRDAGTIRHGPWWDEVAPLVELLLAHETDLPGEWA